MKVLISFLFIFIPLFSVAQTKETIESFSNLEKLEFGNSTDKLAKYIKYDLNTSKVFNGKLDLEYQYLEQGDYIVAYSSVKLIETFLSKNSDKKHFITWGSIDGPEIGFTIFESEKPHKILGQIYSRQLIIPGNGFIYSIERENLNFFVKKKYKIEKNNIEEVKQPLYGVNIDSYTLKPITIFEDQQLTKPIATIPENGAIKILAAKEPFEYLSLYLVQSSFGLVGWTKLEASQYRSTAVEGLFYYGD